MVNIVLVYKSGDLKLCKYNEIKGDELYKKCKFKKSDNFEKRTIWKTKKNYNFISVSLYSRNTGKANTENKYDFPPPVDNSLYFGVCALVADDKDNNRVDLSIDDWKTFYEELFGGFENLDDTCYEDENEIDELEKIPDKLKTKSGYLKDDFVVDDNVIENDSINLTESIGSTGTTGTTGTTESIGSTESDDDESIDLKYEEYSYSDED